MKHEDFALAPEPRFFLKPKTLADISRANEKNDQTSFFTIFVFAFKTSIYRLKFHVEAIFCETTINVS